MRKVTRLARDPQKEMRIIDEAMTEFAANGYHKTRVEDIADNADVSKGLVFKYYESKSQLYLTVLKEATERVMSVADLHVWQNSEDLVAMIINATQYKIKLQLKFQKEFKVLLDAYVRSNQLPEEARHYVKDNLIDNAALQNEITGPVLARIKLKPGVRREDVYEMLNLIQGSYSVKIQQYLAAHPDMNNIEDMDDLIGTLTRYLEIFEHGFSAD
ncbi:TetR/AcrR family transcriptional regulator [Lapidilactobacillus mulanensis]|uniref:TetR/AcrR family transcriptional regulator n=1 Tax=Lapidilactobacillus mulanensis TaxID=2485999 RepID=A0ABW4DLE7_9LACO|nr:TetR/AcrR family transcriptional regulator [Lapidilactobacillus mulanensis]